MLSDNYNHLQKAMPYLHEYGKKALGTIIENGNSTGIIEVHVNEFSIGYHEEHIKDLLAGMGYSVTSNPSIEKIYIR